MEPMEINVAGYRTKLKINYNLWEAKRQTVVEFFFFIFPVDHGEVGKDCQLFYLGVSIWGVFLIGGQNSRGSNEVKNGVFNLFCCLALLIISIKKLIFLSIKRKWIWFFPKIAGWHKVPNFFSWDYLSAKTIRKVTCVFWVYFFGILTTV